MAVRFDRAGVLVLHGHDVLSRPDAIEFRARSNRPDVSDVFVEATVTVDRWPTRHGQAVLLERDGAGWTKRAESMPYDCLHLQRATPMRLVFSEYIPMQAGQVYRLQLPTAVLVQPTINLCVLERASQTPGGTSVRGGAAA